LPTALQLVEAVEEAASMMKQSRRRLKHKPGFDPSEVGTVKDSRIEYPPLSAVAPLLPACDRIVALRYRMHLENIPLAPSTIDLRLAAVRRFAYEASDSGLVSPELVAGIRRVKGGKRFGQPVGNWLTAEEGHQLMAAEVRHHRTGSRQKPFSAITRGG